jgi:predicted SprT family Zn-dependent metalloprotease
MESKNDSKPVNNIDGYIEDMLFAEYDELDYLEDLSRVQEKKPESLLQNKKVTINLDPDFDIWEDFQLFNMLFFENKLGCIRLEWSKRMTLCAGIFSVRRGDAVIRLSEPLLKFRTVGEIKETLIHEMIHAWVYVLNLDMSDDASGHGMNFKLKMFDINKQTGLKITVYHSFHDEVEYHRKHVWRCNGSCQNDHPYYGYVKRAMNRAPGKSDTWWQAHQEKCGGEFIKIQGEVKKERKEKVKINVEKKLKKNKENAILDKYITIKKKIT